jgi:predicted phage tail protein
MIESQEKEVLFTVQKGKDFLNYENLQLSLGENDIIITPVPAGSKRGRRKGIIGIALLIAGMFIATSAAAVGLVLMLVGGLMAVQGITEFLTPLPKSEPGEAYLFKGPENKLNQGIPVPLLYGRLIVGGSPFNFGFIRPSQSSSDFALAASGQRPPYSDDPWGRYNSYLNSNPGGGGSSGDSFTEGWNPQ